MIVPAFQPASAVQNTRTTFITYAIVWASYFVFFILIGILSTWFPELVSDEFQQDGILELLKEDPLRLIISAIIIAPIFEEIMFRGLLRPSHSELLLFMSAWMGFFFMLLTGGLDYPYLKMIGLAVVFVSSYYLFQLWFSEKSSTSIRKWFHRYAGFLWVVSSLVFGLVHIYNYVDSFLLNAALVVAIIPRILIGFAAGYLKLRSGVLVWPILLHFLNNAVAIGLMLFFEYWQTNPVSIFRC